MALNSFRGNSGTVTVDGDIVIKKISLGGTAFNTIESVEREKEILDDLGYLVNEDKKEENEEVNVKFIRMRHLGTPLTEYLKKTYLIFTVISD